ncbi:MAG: hypothetical protein LBI64_05820 [Coriobacteriales bacterium]|jgi:ethanolamine utilization cobalamin adenosyltransferase|nr:hypothetical protein [Coriobacteriales bacterium]
MKLITEDAIKKIIQAGTAITDGELHLPAEVMLTPSARAVVIDRKLKLVIDDTTLKRKAAACTGTTPPSKATDSPDLGTGKYQIEGGGFLNEKPEHLTQLQGNILVPKDDPRIHLRGKVDSLIAELLKVQVRAAALGRQSLVDDLEEVYRFIGGLSRSEVLDEPFEADTVAGLAYEEVRAVSHNPNRYFGRGHLFNISYTEGELPILLNALRASSRSCELAFYEAFKTADGSVARSDLMEGYNRLSSIIYILCLRAITGHYGTN